MMKKTAALALFALAIGCSGGEPEAESGADTLAVAAAPATAPAVSDPQIAAIVVAANAADSAGGELAKTKSTNAQVTGFAQRMITDHAGVNAQAVALVTRLGVTPEESPASEQQRQAGLDNIQRLQSLSGAEFDRAYVDNEVAYHEGLLQAIDTILLPSAQNAELRTLLEQTRPAVEAHLEHARQLQGELAGS